MASYIEKSINVGIVIPTYNRSATLKDAVNSALRQTHKELEIIVMDDCSTDNTAAYLKTITDNRVSFVVNDVNLGLAANINKGVSLLSKEVEWCTILCDDDYLHEECIESLVRTVLFEKAASVVHGHIIFHDFNGNLLNEGRPSPPQESALKFIVSRALFIKDRYLSGVMFSTKHFNSIGGYPRFESGLAADDALIFALALKDKLYYTAESVTYIRIHEGAESRQCDDIRKHISAIREYNRYCFLHARISGKMNLEKLKVLKIYLKMFVKASNIHLWNTSFRIHMSNDHSYAKSRLRQLYGLGVNPRFDFPTRIRLISWLGLLTGICLEKYITFDELVNKLRVISKKFIKLILMPVIIILLYVILSLIQYR